MDYLQFMQPILDSWQQLGGEIKTIACYEGFPVYGLKKTVVQAQGSIIITSGIHGDEIGSLCGLNDWIQQDFASLQHNLNVYVLPCLNPMGVVKQQRATGSGVDLNRQFHIDTHPIVQGIRKFLGTERFLLSLDLHEDLEEAKFYLWEIRDQAKDISRLVVDCMRNHFPISDAEAPDGILVHEGIIAGDITSVSQRIAKRLAGHPFAYFMTQYYTNYSITTEIPGQGDVEQRKSAQKALLNCVFGLDLVNEKRGN